jgi:MutS-like protein
MQYSDPLKIYESQLPALDGQLNNLLKKKNRLAWLRFFSLLAAGAALWQLWSFSWIIALISSALLIALFLRFVLSDINNRESIENTKRLIGINKEEIDILNHHFTHRPDGQCFPPEHHDYANDLDLFGKASLYQYINRTHSEQGNKLLADWLLQPAQTELIKKRQQAANELKDHIFSLQQLRSYGIANPVTIAAEENVGKWLQVENRFRLNTLWKLVRFIFPAVSITTLLLYIFSVIHSSAFYPLMLLFLAIAFSITKAIMPDYALLNKIVPELETLFQSIRWIETFKAKTELIQALQKSLGTGSQKASTSILQLKKILERLDYRYNPLVHIPLNIFLAWDLQQAFALEKWKSGKETTVANWFHILAEMESLVTLATVCVNHPRWTFPQIPSEHGVFLAKDMGHPLIPVGKRVNNSFAVKGSQQLSLITGSNMAGKSTFLRSAGINVVLAMMGSPACASELIVSHMKVISSMRVSDNLEENTSTFYAELKKLKQIIDAVNKHEKVFLLLDEILRGTNSTDRHAGSMAFIKQLVKEKAFALVATHDLELTKLAEEFPRDIHNYHFDVQVTGEELYFDYVLKDGICRSMNASLLMKKIGIEL